MTLWAHWDYELIKLFSVEFKTRNNITETCYKLSSIIRPLVNFLDLKDQYPQNWHFDVGNSPKLSFYANYQLTSEHEIYLEFVTVTKFRNVLGNIRASSHDLAVERRRYSILRLKEIKENTNFVILRLKSNFTLF